MKRIAIVGAGYAGLSAAYELGRLGYQVEILERSLEVGGLAAATTTNGSSIERYYHHFFTSDKDILRLSKELGIDGAIRWIKPKTALYFEGVTYSLKGAKDLLRFSPLPFFERVKMGFLIVDSYFRNDWKSLDRITAQDWIVSNVGRRTYEVLWQPLLVSKFGRHAAEISAAWLWNKLKLRGSSRNKKGEEVLGYFDGGFSTFTSALLRKLDKSGVVVQTGALITSLDIGTDKVGVITETGRRDYDRLIWTAAPSALAEFIENNSYKERLQAVIYQANICLILELKKPLSDVYWLTIEDSDYPFVAIIEHTNFVSSKHYGGRSIVYLSRYLSSEDPLFSRPDEQIEKIFFSALRQIYPRLNKQDVLRSTVSRARYAQPVVKKGSAERILPITTPYPRLFLATMAQVFPQDRGTNYALSIGRQAALTVHRSILSKKK